MPKSITEQTTQTEDPFSPHYKCERCKKTFPMEDEFKQRIPMRKFLRSPGTLRYSSVEILNIPHHICYQCWDDIKAEIQKILNF